MPTLPVTVTEVTDLGTGIWGVTVALADGTLARYVIPDNLATIEGVTISALAMAQLLDPAVTRVTAHHRHHRRFDPRP